MPKQDNIAIRLSSLKKVFGTLTAVDGVDLEIRRGEIFGLVGPDGAGKTTTIRLLCGIIEPSGGKAFVNGIDVSLYPDLARESIGYMPQRFSLYGDLTVNENLKFFGNMFHVPEETRIRREIELLSAARMEPFRDRLANDLSGGMKQKLALACALIHAPKILILDEPTTGVDPVSRRDFWRILYSLLKSGSTIFVSTPYMDEAERCNRIAFIERGKILLCDTPDSIRKHLKGEMLELTAKPQRKAKEILSELPFVLGIQVFGDRLHLWLEDVTTDRQRVENALANGNIVVKRSEERRVGKECRSRWSPDH